MSIIIINYRTAELIINCLITLLIELKNINARIVVVDNNSEDKSPFLIKEWLVENDIESRVIFIQAENNAGFSAGNNLGIRAQDSRYYLLLNSDTLVSPGAIQIILDTIVRNSDAGIVSPRLEWPDGKGQESCFRFHTPLSQFLGAANTGLFDRLFNRYIVALPLQNRILNPDWTSFACVLIKREVFQQIGLLDEGYFMYFEDAEFCHRALKAGWKIIHNPEARVVHLRGGSSPVKQNSRLKKRLPKYYYESRTRFFYQAYGRYRLILANLMWELGRFVSKVRQISGRTDKVAIEKQWLDIWTNCLNPLKKYSHPES